MSIVDRSRTRRCGISVGRPRKPKIGKAVINTLTPDHAEINVGGPAPFPRAKIEWDREKKERISQVRRRLNA